MYIFYLPVEIDALKQNKDSNGQFSIQVSQSVLERAGVSLSEVYEHAVEKCKKKSGNNSHVENARRNRLPY